MKNLIFSCCFLFAFTLQAQTDVNLILNHQFDGVPFVYSAIYLDDQGRAVEFNRVQYYMSSFELIHDGAQTTPLTSLYVLTNANVSNYPLGNFNVTDVEGFNFDLGVDYSANHGNSSNYPLSHPLAPQTPLMDWGWPSGYFFLVLNGKVDNNADGVPETPFEMNAIGDMMLKDVDLILSASPTTNTIDITLNVRIENWIKNIDLATVGITHNSGSTNQTMCANTITRQVFEALQITGISQIEIPSYITTDYTMAYAPVLNYKLSAKSDYSLAIRDINGKLIIQEEHLGFEGNYFIKKELKSGIYFATFSGNSKLLTHKFVVQR